MAEVLEVGAVDLAEEDSEVGEEVVLEDLAEEAPVAEDRSENGSELEIVN